MKHPENANSPPQLSQDLDAYSASIRSRALADSVRRLLPRWSAYAAAVGSGLAMTSAADADIVYSGSINQTINIATATKLPFTMHGAANKFSLRLFKSRTIGSVKLSGVGANPKVFATATHAAHLLKRFTAPAPISAAAGSIRANRTAAGKSGGSTFGNFNAGTKGFAGVRVGSGTNLEFGWVRLSFQNDGGGFPDAVTLVDWALETTPNTAINAGDTGAVPEPSSLLLTMLAAGSTGVLAWRKRRKAAAEAAAASEPTA